MRGENADPRGDLNVTAPVVFGRMHILPIVTKLLRAHLQLNVNLILVDRVVRLVEEGIDVAVRIADLSDSSLNVVRFWINAAGQYPVPRDSYYMAGAGGQTTMIVPSHDLVVAEIRHPRRIVCASRTHLG